MNYHCFLCDKLLTLENNSKEHILKNSIGGRKKVLNFICSTCNSKTGEEWDVEVDNLFGAYLSLLLGIKRERGRVPRKKVIDTLTDKSYFLERGKIVLADPTYNISDEKLTITAPNKKRAKQYLSQLKSEDVIPQSVMHLTSEEVEGEEKITTELKFNIPELDSGFSRSVTKSALALLSVNRQALDSCIKAKKFLLNKEAPCLSYLYTYDPLENRPFACPLHYVHVFSSYNKIMAYVELFGIARYFLILSDDYDGKKINTTYSINPQTGNELQLNIKPDSKVSPVLFDIHPSKLSYDLFNEQNYERLVYKSFEESIVKALENQKNKEEIDFKQFGEDISQYFISSPILKEAAGRTHYLNFMNLKFEELLNGLYASLSKQI